MRARIVTLQRAARLLAKTQADYLEFLSPAKEGPGSRGGGPEGWGAKLVDLYAKGMSDKSKIARAASGLAAASRPGSGNFGVSAMAGAGGAGLTVIVNLNGMVMPPTQAQVYELGRLVGPAIATHLRDRGLLPRS
jgi:hypothetical protein